MEFFLLTGNAVTDMATPTKSAKLAKEIPSCESIG